ncbi:peptidase [Oceanispirochaeta crateris]|uniref:Peptidase n=1 Tax=Oceanispirochaeta crateris TaxID=2518645 RepID=A0A5C1QFJ4_9SPIO|nr:peptidase [Oceanispirochaeta crateris]QEN06815.1 peptidase [Oceanispirochaeta crateris]
MFIDCKALETGKEIRNFNALAQIFKEGDLVSPKGVLKEEFKVFMGGAFFRKSNDPKEELFPWVFSTFDLDRDDERIDPAGWDLKHYLKNPVILWAHDSRIPAIGFSQDTAVKDRILGGNILFNSQEIDPFGWGIGRRVAAGVIRAGSVGFMVREVEIAEVDGESTLIFRSQELLEFSICNIPSNPMALNRDFIPPEELSLVSEETIPSFWKGIIKSHGGHYE